MTSGSFDMPLGDLIDAYCHGVATDAQLASLAARLAADPVARRLFAESLEVHAALRWRESASENSEPGTRNSERATVAAPPAPRSAFGVRRSAYALAAALLLAACGVAIYLLALDEIPETRIPNPAAPVAVITATDGVAWLTEPLSPGTDLSPQTLRFEQGEIELAFLDGATVTVTGPADLDLTSRSHTRMRLGRLEARIVGGGFVVDTPRGVRVTDLSTEFAVTVDPDGSTSVRVIDGRVRLSAGGSDTELAGGEARHVDATGAVRVIDSAAIAITGRSESTLLTPPAYADAIRPLDPVAWLRFDSVSQAVTADASGHAHHATLVADAAIARIGDAGSLLLPVGGFGHAVVAPAPDMDNPGNRLTVAAWVHLADREHQAIVHKWSDGFGYSLEIHQGKPGFVVAFANDYARAVHVKADQPMPIDRWVQLVGVYDGQIVSIYVDGQIAASMAVPSLDAPVNVSGGPITIGRRGDRSDGFAHGSIDEVAIFAAALTPEQIAALFAAMHRD